MRQTTRLARRLAGGLLVAAVVGAGVASPALAVDLPNGAPLTQPDTAATSVGSAVEIDVLANDTDPDGDALTVSSVNTNGSNGTATVGPDNRVTYTGGSQPGFANLSYIVADGRGGQTWGYIYVVVAALDTEADDPPMANGDSAEGLEGRPVVIPVLANDLDVDSPTLTVTAVTQPASTTSGSGTVTINPDQTVTYTPSPENPGSYASFTYTVSDGVSSVTGFAAIYYRPMNGPENDLPLAVSDNAITVRSAPVTVAVLANDMDVDGDTVQLTGASISPPGSGPGAATVVADLSAGIVTYTPATVETYPSYPYGTAFTYTISDGHGGTASGYVSVTILADDPDSDDPPRPTADSAVTVGPTPVIIDVLANDADIDTPRAELTVSLSPSPSPSAVVNPDRTVTFSPQAGFFGSSGFSYTVSDGTSSASAYVSVEVLGMDRPGNDLPAANGDNLTVLQDRPATIAVLANDHDFDADDVLRVTGLRPSTYSVGPDVLTLTTYNGGTAEVAPDGSAVLFTPGLGFVGYESFAYTVFDGTAYASASVSLNVAAVQTANKRPILASDAVLVPQGGSVVIHPLTNDFDPDGDALTITAAGYTYPGTVTVTDAGQSLTYQAPATYSGSTSVSYSVSDGSHTESGYVDVYVHLTDSPGTNSAPRTLSDQVIAAAGAPVTVDVLANDFDIDTPRAGLTVTVMPPFSGTATVNHPDETVTFTPAPGASGNFSLSYNVFDGDNTTAGSLSGQLLTIDSAGNDPPAAKADFLTVLADTTATLAVLANDYDVDAGDGLAVTGLFVAQGDVPATTLTLGNGATATVAAGGAGIVYTTAPGGGTGNSFHYIVSDEEASVSAAVSVQIAYPQTGINQWPVAASDAAAVRRGGSVVIRPLANDFDADGDPLLIASATSYQGTPTVSADGQSLTFSPTTPTGPPPSGPISIFYSVSDGQGHSASSSINVDVVLVDSPGVNDPPQAASDSALSAGGPVTIDVLANDFDIDTARNGLTVTIPPSPFNGAAVVNSDQTVTFTPAPGTFGNSSFSYSVFDGTSSASSYVTIEVLGMDRLGNDVPVARGDSLAMLQDTVRVLPVLTNDYDFDAADVLTVTGLRRSPFDADALQITTSNGGTAEVADGGGGIRFTPTTGYSGSEYFTYTVSDGTIAVTSSVSVNVLGTGNRPPTTSSDSAMVGEGGSVVIQPLVNDFDSDGDPLQITSASAYQGTVTVSADGQRLTYGAPASYLGTTSISYTVSDGQGHNSFGNVSVSVHPVDHPGLNDAPFAKSDSAGVYSGASVTIAVLTNDFDPDGDDLVVTRILPVPSFPDAGMAEVGPGGHSVVFTAASPSVGPPPFYAYFQYEVSDGHGGTDIENVSVQIYLLNTPGNEPPSANYDSAVTGTGVPVTIAVLANDTDIDGDSLTVTDVTLNSGSSGQAQISADGRSVVYTAPADPAISYDGFSYEISDGNGATATGSVSVQILIQDGAGNDAPLARYDSTSTYQDMAVRIAVLDNDFDFEGDTLSIDSVVEAPAHGTVTIDGSDLLYTPRSAFSGYDYLRYRVSDGALTSEADVAVQVVALDHDGNDAPRTQDDWASTLQDGPGVTIDVLANDADFEHDTLSLVGVGAPGHGTAVITSDQIRYTPAPGFDGTDQFTYVISDGSLESEPATVHVYVTPDPAGPRNDAPAAGPDSAITTTGQPVDVAVLANDTDREGDVLTLTAVADPAHGQASVTAAGAVRYTSDADFTGDDTFTYTVSDGHGFATGSISIQVARLAVDVVVAAGGTASTATSATPETPVAIEVMTPSGGQVTIVEMPVTGTQAGFTLVGSQINIEAPDASVAVPLRLVFRIDRGVLEAQGGSATTVTVFRNGMPAGECPGSTTADPDPCVTSRTYDAASDDVVLTVLAAHASQWAFGVAVASPAPDPEAEIAVHPALPPVVVPSPSGKGYWLVARDGGVFAFGDAAFHGSTGATPLNQPIVGLAPSPSGNGYWLVARDGGVFAFGDAAFHGSTGATPLNQPIVGLAPSPSGNGYWLVARDGGVFAFGDAAFHGSTGATPLNQPIVGLAPSPSGNGYWLVARDGGVFAFGDAAFHGSTGATPLNQPIVGLAPSPSGNGYWLVARDGGVFAFGDAAFHGSTGATPLNQPIVGLAPSPSGNGYWLVARDGGVFAFGDAAFHGSTGAMSLNQEIIGLGVFVR